MRQRQLGNSGLRVSRTALGTMSWGTDTDAEEAASQLVAFVDAGGTLVDTADIYGEGEGERILGSLLADLVPREDIVLATKAVARRTDGPFGGGASRGALLSALDGSLRRLGTDHIDLWQLHAWDSAVPLEETLAALDTAVSAGKVRYVGVSNYTGWQLASAATRQRFSPDATPANPIVSTQMEYSLLERGVEREVVHAARHHGVGLLAWAPLGHDLGFNILTPMDRKAGEVNLQIQEMSLHIETKTADDVFVRITVAVQYRIMPSRIREAYYELSNPRTQIESYVYDEVRAHPTVIAATSATEIARPSTFCVMKSWMICASVAGSCSTGPL
jgi:aryl-alcohol dehydrogenase-like predicted oxidoreductase